jgi:hypothetical protein
MNVTFVALKLNYQNKDYQIRILIHFEFLLKIYQN